MIAFSAEDATSKNLTDVQQGFLRLLPAIVRYAAYAFRFFGEEARQEAVQETVANAFVAFARLVEQGKQEVAHATPLARFAVAQVTGGRKVGGRLNGRDVLSPYAQRRHGIRVSRLNRPDRLEDQWREIVVEDRRAGPDHVAMVRLDFAAWLELLPPRDRRIAEVLATGEQTSEVARQFGLSPARVSQLRRELHDDWETFQGEADAPETDAQDKNQHTTQRRTKCRSS